MAYQHRAELIRACITLVQNWIARGRPAGQASLGSFERWAAVIGGILQSAGIDGFLDNSSDQAAQDADEQGSRWQRFVQDWWHDHHDRAVGPGALVDIAYGHSLIREEKDGSPESRARSAATRLGLALSRRAGRAFRLKHHEREIVITITRATVEGERSRSRPGFALRPAAETHPNVGDVGEKPKCAEDPLKIKQNFCPNVDGGSLTLSDHVGATKVLENKGKSQTSPTSHTLGAGFPESGAGK